MLPDDEPAMFGAKTTRSTTAGGSVDPMISQSRGGTPSGNANPMSGGIYMEDGGAIPDDDSDGDAGNDALGSQESDDRATSAFSDALNAVNSALMYGRQKHGLPSDNDGNEEGSYAFEDGGAVPDDDGEDGGGDDAVTENGGDGAGDNGGYKADPGDNSGAAPVYAPDDNSGAAPVLPLDDGDGARRQSAQSVLSYLMGSDGVAPQVLDNYKADTQGSEGDRNLMAVQRAYEQDGDQGAWGVMQALRRKYDLFMNHGRAAANNDDYANAAASIMKAFDNLPDGNNVQAQPAPNGVAVRFVNAQGQPTAAAQLNKQQIDQLTNTGKSGQFDAMLEMGAPKVLQTLAGRGVTDNNGTRAQPDNMQVQTEEPASRGSNNGGSEAVRDSSGYYPYGKTTEQPEVGPNKDATRELGKNDTFYPQGKRGPFYRDETLIRTPEYNAMMRDQGATPIKDRRGYTTGWERKPGTGDIDAAGDGQHNPVRILPGPNSDRAQRGGNGDKIDVARERNSGMMAREKLRQEGLNNRAQMSSDRQRAGQEARAKLEQQKALALAERMERQSGDRTMQERGRMARSAINNPNFLLQTDEQRDAIYKKFGIDQLMQGQGAQAAPSTPQATAPRPQAPQPQQQNGNGSPAQRPQNVPQGAKPYNGKWYTRGPNGEAVEVK